MDLHLHRQKAKGKEKPWLNERPIENSAIEELAKLYEEPGIKHLQKHIKKAIAIDTGKQVAITANY